MNKPTIAFLGAGIMAKGMVRNLQKDGFPVRLYNRTLSKAEALMAPGTIVHATPCDAAAEADIVIACVLDNEANESVWFGEYGAIKSARPSVICIEMSTLSIPQIDSWTRRIQQAGLVAIDCPVTGSKSGANEASLTLFLGGSVDDIAKVQAVFSAISRQQFHFGINGNGIRFKLAYNMLGASILVALAEAIGFAGQLGLDVGQVVEALSKNKHSWSAAAARSKGAQIATGEHSDISVTLDIIQKDIAYALESAAEVGYEPPTAKSVLRTLESAQDNGLGHLDMSVVGNLFVKK